MALAIDGVALVTGAGKVFQPQVKIQTSDEYRTAKGSGIGRECCLAYAAEGVRGVVMADLNHEAALQTTRESEAVATHPDYKALAVSVDVGDPNSVQNMVKEAMDMFGRIDYNVNSAGVGVQKPLPVEDADLVEMNRFWQVNVLGTLNCMQAVTKVMKTQSVKTYSSRGKVREVGRGVILNLGSCNSYVATPNIVQYTTTKHAVLGMTRNAGKFMHLGFCRIELLLVVQAYMWFKNSAGQCTSWHSGQRYLSRLGRDTNGRRSNSW
jgi:NAD(P)-dependent dehydrogenase (short-subunit alcohol dehydrogenase family)